MPSLDSVVLRRLRDVLADGAGVRDARSLNVGRVVALASALPDGARMSIDVEATTELGLPIVIVQPPSAESVVAYGTFNSLTRREREVAAFVAAGLANSHIAQRLCLSTATIKDHVHHILDKTGLPNRTALAAAWRDSTASLAGSPLASSTEVWQ